MANKIVEQITALNITGNVIPNRWWKAITFDSGKPDSVAVVLLSEIVYWYRATERRSEETGATVGFDKKFHGDMLQRSYQSFSEQFGYTKRQVSDAMKRLKEQGLIHMEFRTITVNGTQLNNVLYLAPNPRKIREITFGKEDASTLSRLNVTGTTLERSPLPRSNVTAPTLERETNTEITTEITTENSIKDTRENSREKKSSSNMEKFDLSSWPEKPSEQIWQDWVKQRKALRATVTQTVINRFGKQLHEAKQAGFSVDDCLGKCVERGWRGFEAQWMSNAGTKPQGSGYMRQSMRDIDYHKGVDENGRF